MNRPKVFKLKKVELPAGGRVALEGRISLVDLTTRKHHQASIAWNCAADAARGSFARSQVPKLRAWARKDGTMARLFGTLLATTVLLLAAHGARAEPLPDVLADAPPPLFSYEPTPWLGFSGMCRPGTRAPCVCADGAPSTRVCDPSGVRFSLCACASVSVDLPRPPVVVIETPMPPPIRVRRHRNRPPSKPSSGLGLLIGGGVTLAHGTASLIWGIERVRDKPRDPLGIVLISTGGVAMAAGLPLTIVGIVFLATRGLHPEQNKKVESQAAARGFLSGVSIAPAPNGFALFF